MDIQTMFKLGMKRDIPAILPPMDAGLILNLGPGNTDIPGTKGLGLPKWNADTEAIPFDSDCATAIYAFHFLEHVADPIGVLRECERVLKFGGQMLIVVPYGAGHMAVQDITHRNFFNEDTWNHVFSNSYYDPEGDAEPKRWRLQVYFNMIMGVKGQNLALCSQLVKGK